MTPVASPAPVLPGAQTPATGAAPEAAAAPTPGSLVPTFLQALDGAAAEAAAGGKVDPAAGKPGDADGKDAKDTKGSKAAPADALADVAAVVAAAPPVAVAETGVAIAAAPPAAPDLPAAAAVPAPAAPGAPVQVPPDPAVVAPQPTPSPGTDAQTAAQAGTVAEPILAPGPQNPAGKIGPSAVDAPAAQTAGSEPPSPQVPKTAPTQGAVARPETARSASAAAPTQARLLAAVHPNAPHVGAAAPAPSAAASPTAPAAVAQTQDGPTAPISEPAAAVPVVVSSRLEHLPSVARAVIQTSARTGVGRARIDLRPPELGHVEIRLRYSTDGVRATVTASSAAAVQALGSTTGDLKRALEAQGLTVLGLDISQAGPEDHRRPDGDANLPSTPGGTSGAPLEDDDDTTTTTISHLRVPAAGSTVDVLA